MARLDLLNQGATRFDGFLYAEIGQDGEGNAISVLSALARLGLDPWDEAASLADLSDAGARTRLGGVLDQFTDVPELDHGAAISRLISLLPRSSGRAGVAGLLPPDASALGFGPIAAVVLVVLMLVQSFIPVLG